MSEEWYYIDTQGGQQGPVTLAVFAQHFQQGKCSEQSACWNATLPDWAVISSIDGLLAKLKPAAAAAAPTPAPKPTNTSANDWRAMKDDTGREYYYNSRTGQSSWDKPAELSAASSVASAISNMAAQRPAKLQMEKLGAPEPVSTGVVSTAPLQIVRRAEPEHGWKALKTAEGHEYYYNSKTGVTQWEKPEELKTSDDYERAGEWFWVPHEHHGYVPAKKTNTSAGKTNFESESGERFSFNDKQLKDLEPMKWLQLRQLQSDLVMLDVMNKPLILYNLKKRFENNEIYTAIGTILISINPYKRLPLYTPAVMEEYIRRGNRKLPPHVFLIADDAFKSLLENRQGQSIVISGESGAGKTECTKQALQYLAEIAGSATSNVQEMILASNPILEAFGNAKTVRNNNSSRFGKYVEIYFDARAQICGSTNTNYLLEKIRVVKQSNGERNYHAFYQLLRGASSQEKQKFSLLDVSKYWYLSQSGCDTVDDMDDVTEHEEVVKSMHELGWKKDEIDQVYQTVSGVLHIGNIAFRSTGDRQSEVTNSSSVATVCSLLSLNAAAFNKAVTTRMIRVQGQADIEVGLSKDEAEAARDALAKFIYEKLFDWIVARINISIGRGNAQNETIGILDIFGFEIFQHNQFEQLCINFTNEKLQQFFNQHTFKKEEELYRYEGINFAHVHYIDNQPVLDLIEMRPKGILPSVDEEIRMPKGTDKTFLQKLTTNHQGNKYYKQYLKNPDMFIVEHYAGTVVYDSNGFLEKNRDQLNEDASAVLTSSGFKFLARLFEERDGNKKATLGSKFAKQLNDLMAALNATEPHYIRCVKPNPNKAPMEMHGQMSLEQLQYAGVFEAVTIRKQGFPFRLTHTEFFKRYKCLYKDKHWDNRTIENCKFLINAMGQNPNEVQIGVSRVLYRAEQHRAMELKRNLAVEEVTIYAQKYCRRVLTKLLRQRCTKFKPILKAAIDSRSIEKVDEAIAQAAGLGFPIYELKQAQRMKFVFQEEKRLEQLFTILVNQDPQDSYDAFQAAVASADDIELKSPASNQVRKLYYEAKAVRDAIIADAEKQEKVLDEVQMKAILERADALPSFINESVERLRNLLYNTSEDIFVKMQLKAAVQLRDPELVQAREIRVKDLFLDKSGNMFVFKNFTLLYPPQGWADLKVISFNREELAAGMLKWTDSTIHAPLTASIDPQNKELYNTAKRLFKNVLGFMGDKKQQQPIMLAVEMITEALKIPVLRDELYCQVIKQLNNNPNAESTRKGWDLMICLLHSFPPSSTLDNYLQMFFRTSANPPRKFINLMHKTMYQGAVTNFPTESELQNWISTQGSLDCDDYKTKIAKAEARLKEQQRAGTAPAPVEKRNGYGFGWGGNGAQPGPPAGGPGAPSGYGAGRPGPGFGAGPGLGAGPGPSSFGGMGAPGGVPGGVALPKPTAAPAPAAAPVAAPAPAGPPDHLQWHVIDSTEAQVGPLTKQQLQAMYKSGQITGESYCWNEAMSGWEPINTQTSLLEYIKY